MSDTLLLCPYCGWPAERGAGGLDIHCSNQYGCDAFDCSMSIKDWNRRYVCPDKNGDKVFAGDEVKCGPFQGKVVADMISGMGLLVEGDVLPLYLPHKFEIELIKEPT